MTRTIVCQHAGRYGFREVLGTHDLVCRECGMPTPGYEALHAALVFFRGGPLDGRVYYAADLSKQEYTATLPVYQYKWTAEKITSDNTGQTARVWQWRGPESVSLTAPQGNKDNDKESSKMASQNLTTSGRTPEQLFEWRKSMNLSRAQLAAKSGITQAQINSMERSGKRIKEGVMDAVEAALTSIASEREQSTAGDTDQEGHTPEPAAPPASE